MLDRLLIIDFKSRGRSTVPRVVMPTLPPSFFPTVKAKASTISTMEKRPTTGLKIGKTSNVSVLLRKQDGQKRKPRLRPTTSLVDGQPRLEAQVHLDRRSHG